MPNCKSIVINDLNRDAADLCSNMVHLLSGVVLLIDPRLAARRWRTLWIVLFFHQFLDLPYQHCQVSLIVADGNKADDAFFVD